MQNRIVQYFFTFSVLLLLQQCKKTYEPTILKSDSSFLVVNGFINIGPGALTSIQLSRTLKLTDTITSNPELYASISIESENGTLYPLFENGNDGSYVSSPLYLDNILKYRLSINTKNGGKYESDFVNCKQTPPIDSLTWNQKDNVTIYANTHDPANNARYYRWNYSETWEYQSQIESIWGVSNGMIYTTDTNTQFHVCWRNGESTDIILGSSATLSQDIINANPIATIPKNDGRLDFRYSSLIRQYALTADAYHYWQIIQKNSQQLGTLFDQQPSQISGNIHSLNNPDELVVGFVSAATEQTLRFFIKNNQLINWHSIPQGFACSEVKIPQNPVDFRIYDYSDTTYGPWYFITGGPLVLNKNACMDCRYLGGTNQKPAFW
jgi:Domain of unknown function (DUF4249)